MNNRRKKQGSGAAENSGQLVRPSRLSRSGLQVFVNVFVRDHPDVAKLSAEPTSATEDANSGWVNAESFGGL